MKANGSSELNTVLSLLNRRARPRTAVSDPNVTIKGGSRRKAISAPLTRPNTNPATRQASKPRKEKLGTSETISPNIADAATIEPTERSMPPVRMTNVIPAASTVLMEAWAATMERFCRLMKRPSVKAVAQFPVCSSPEKNWNISPNKIRIGNIPSAWSVEKKDDLGMVSMVAVCAVIGKEQSDDNFTREQKMRPSRWRLYFPELMEAGLGYYPPCRRFFLRA